MYYPYVRGRQSDLLALRDTTKQLGIKKRVCPVVEPVMGSLSGVNAFLKAANTRHPHIVIVNPAVGDLVGKQSDIELIVNPYLTIKGSLTHPGLYVGPNTTQADVDVFLKKYAAHHTALVFSRPNPAHFGSGLKFPTGVKPPVCIFIDGKVSPSFMNSIKGTKRVLIRDGFIAQAKNALYPPRDFFSDLHLTYAKTGFDGFGDFTIVEDSYSPGGGPAHAVAIHLTEQNPSKEIEINHFVSDRTVGAVDTPGKFMEALKKLVAHVNGRRTSFSYSQACKHYEQLHNTRHFPGLPSVKRISIRHHLELMDSIL